MTPDNGSFMVAAYLVLGVLYGAYAVWVLRSDGRR